MYLLRHRIFLIEHPGLTTRAGIRPRDRFYDVVIDRRVIVDTSECGIVVILTRDNSVVHGIASSGDVDPTSPISVIPFPRE
mgnify:CR=1 FL=1